MINEVVLEGIVVKTWKYAEDLLFRIACYRDLDLPSKSLNDVQDAADFVTIRVLKGNLGAPVVVLVAYGAYQLLGARIAEVVRDVAGRL